jgi:hypothetical protein
MESKYSTETSLKLQPDIDPSPHTTATNHSHPQLTGKVKSVDERLPMEFKPLQGKKIDNMTVEEIDAELAFIIPKLSDEQLNQLQEYHNELFDDDNQDGSDSGSDTEDLEDDEDDEHIVQEKQIAESVSESDSTDSDS